MPRRAYIEALLHLNDIELDIGGDIGIVVDVVTGEAEQLQEFLLVAGVVGDVEQVVAGDLRPQFLTGLLDVVLQLPVVETQTTGLVGGDFGSSSSIAGEDFSSVSGFGSG